MSEVHNTIDEFLDSKKYLELETLDERKIAIEELLIELSEKGTKNLREPLIKRESIHYFENNNQFYFEFNNGVSSAIYLKSIFNSNIGGSLNKTNSPRHLQTTTNLTNDTESKLENQWNSSIMFFGWDNMTKADSCYSKWSKTVDNCKHRNMNMSLYYAPRVQDYKSNLLKHDFICIAEHGANYKTIDGKTKYCFAVYGESITDEKNNNIYSDDIATERIYAVYDGSILDGTTSEQKGFYLITPEFFEHYYKDNSLKDSIIYLSSCMGFGETGNIDYGFAKTFVEECGVKAVVGFCNSVWLNYANSLLDTFTMYLSTGKSIKQAFNEAKQFCGYDDKSYAELFGETLGYATEKSGMLPAFPILYEKLSTLSGTVKDETTGNAISGVRVEFIDNSSDSLDPVATATTDTNGLFSVKLPYGSYSLSFNHDSYEYYGTTVNVDTENVVLIEPIQLKPNTQYCSITGTVKNKENENIISGVTVELVNSENGSEVTTAITDENGQFTIKFPYGDYSLKFTHDDYMSSSTTVSVKSQPEAMIAKLRFKMSAVSLTPKNQSDTVEYNGHKYKLFDLNMSWEEAKLYCENLGGHLVTITSQEEQNQVSSLLSNGYMMSYWMGGYLLNSNWVWITGEKFEYTYWYPGEPNYSGKYIQIFSSSSGHDEIENGWDNTENEGDLGGGIKLENIGFVCEWDDTNITEKIIIDSGSCGAVGDNITWTFYDDGELAINGNGAMADYQSWADIPWHIYEDQIEIVTIGNRITRIGKMAFADCSNLQKIEIGNSVESIGVKALSATGLTDISIPDSVRTIEDSAFFGCSYLTNIVLGNNVMIIGQMTFQRCVRLSSITIPKSLSSIGSQAFYMCDSLKNVYYKGTSTNWVNIGMGSHNTELTNATIHYNS